MNVSEMNRVERSIVIRAPRERVWKAISDVHEFAKWFGIQASAQAFTPGTRVNAASTHEGSHKGVQFYFIIEEVVPNQRMSWKWHPGMPLPGAEHSTEPMTTVEFTLLDVEEGTRVVVTESGFDHIDLARRANAFADNTAGWEFQMNSLERYVSGTA